MATHGDGIDDDGYEAQVLTLYGDVTPFEMFARIGKEVLTYEAQYGMYPEQVTITTKALHTEARVYFAR